MDNFDKTNKESKKDSQETDPGGISQCYRITILRDFEKETFVAIFDVNFDYFNQTFKHIGDF